jgi:site-specific DNA-methyltransferase (adenine-specific)/adenine-specific DNA-methyltransferase
VIPDDSRNFREEPGDMTNEQRQELIRLLQQDVDIAPEWARILFPPEKREYELVYHGKEREEDILANTLAVPLQPVRTFGKNSEDWHNMLVFGDNLQVMKSLLELKKAGQLYKPMGHQAFVLSISTHRLRRSRSFVGLKTRKLIRTRLLVHNSSSSCGVDWF